MAGHELLVDIAVILAASFPVLWAARRLHLPGIVGFLLTGVAIGPHALGLLKDAGRVEGIAEMGVALILFFVGLHFPLQRLLSLGRTAFVGGGVQMALTAGLGAGAGMLLGARPGTAVFFGFLVSLSSTAVLLPILADRDETAAPYARRFLGVALFQDLAVIPLVLLLPALAPAGAAGVPIATVASRVGLALVGIAVLVAAARTVVPRLLDAAARLGSREAFTGGVLVLVFTLVALSEKIGISAALGAFAAGIVLGESEHVHEVAATLGPFRDLLSSLFFVSIGMLLDPQLLALEPLLVLTLAAAVVVGKTALSLFGLLAAGTTPRTALRAALALATVGEFSFVLARAGARIGLLTPEREQVFVAVAVVTLALAPLLVALGPRLAPLLPERVEEVPEEDPHAKGAPARHVVVVGYGLNGRSVARTLRETGIPHVVVESDPERVGLARHDGVRVVRADATGAEWLDAAGVTRALGVVVAIQDPDGSRRITRLARQRNAEARILVRTRYVSEVAALRQAGADEVIPEEFETSIEIVARVLRLLHVPGNLIATQIRVLRDETYQKLRDPRAAAAPGRRLSALMAAGTTELFLVMPDTVADGVPVCDLRLDAEHVVVPALLRDGQPYAPVPPELVVASGDTLVLAGAHEDLAHAVARLERPRAEPAPAAAATAAPTAASPGRTSPA